MDDPFNVEKLRLPQGYDSKQPRRRNRKTSEAFEDRHFGFPMWWLQAVFPVVKSKEQLVVAIHLWRQNSVRGERGTFDLPNNELKALGITRGVKRRTLEWLAAAGLIRIDFKSAKSAPTITILASNPRKEHP